MRTIAKCLICEGTQHELLYPSTYRQGVDEAHRYFLAHREHSAHGDIRRCKSCGFIFTSPQFEVAEYDAIYSRIGLQNQSKNASAELEAAANMARFRRLKTLINALDMKWGRFLDFGCGSGDFLGVMDGSDGMGFEVGPPGRRTGPAGRIILSDTWADLAGSAAVPNGSLALLTAFDVFEHLADLPATVVLMRGVLRPGGVIALTLPDAGSLMARLMRRHWNMYLLEHLWYFTAPTLDRFMRVQGFEPLHHCSVPYDASVGHALQRLQESTGVRLPLKRFLPNRWILPMPAGVLFAAYRRLD